MKSILFCLNKLTEEGVYNIPLLGKLLTGEDREYLKYSWKIYKRTGAFPSPDTLNDKFDLDLEKSDITKNPDSYLSMMLDRYKDQAFRKALLKLSSIDIISRSNIDLELDKLEGVQRQASSTELSARKIYEDIKSRTVGCKVFIDPIDKEVQGVAYGKVCTIMGYAGQMKTTLALSIMYGNVKEFGYNFAYIVLEGQKREYYLTLLARHSYSIRPDSPLITKNIKKGVLSPEDEEFFYEVEKDYLALPGKIHILDAYDISEGNTISERSIKRALNSINEPLLDAVVVDYIQLFREYRMDNTRDPLESMNSAVEMFTQLSIHYNKPQGLILFLLSQANRTGWLKAARRGGKYDLTALSEVNALERASSYVIANFLDDALAASGELSLQLLKHRDGQKIEEPFTTYTNPAYAFIGDIEGYAQTFSEESLDEVLDGLDSF